MVSVLTVVMYTISLAKQFPSNGHLFFSLQLHDASTLFSMQLQFFKTLCLWSDRIVLLACIIVSNSV